LPPNNDRLPYYVSELGGFPIVVKAIGGTMGVGTIIVESMRSLRSTLDFLRTTSGDYILRQYIEPKHVGRLCVLGEKVIASLRYAIPPDDFRGLPYRQGGQVMNFGKEVESLAIAATKACQYEFTGVDILIGRDGRAWILEANPPSNFVAYERDLGIPIGDMIVAHLLRKSEAILATAQANI
jgi:ribosomal protein S6--L-glutamate ligase